MNTPPVFRSSLLAALAAAILAGCGGNGDSGSSTSSPRIRTQPQSTTAAIGEAATFSVSASGGSSDGLSYQWYRATLPITGATSSSLTIDPVTSADYANYSVRITNSVGTVNSNSVTLSAPDTGAPRITTQPQSATVAAGASVSFSVVATGEDLSYQWLKDGNEISGATSATLTIPTAGSGDVGTYYVRVTNENGSITSGSATLALTSATAPVITTQPTAAVTARVGAALTLSVTASGRAPLTYQWYKGSSPIDGATARTYLITPISTSSVGLYSVQVKNDLGTVTSNNEAVTVIYKPVITTQPTATTVNQGSSFTLLAAANDTVDPTGAVSDANATYRWFRSNGTQVATGRTYTVSSAQAANAGGYYVAVSNDAGTTTSATVNVNVIVRPTITTQPSSTTIAVNQQATFSVVATNGGGTLSYQWYRNGSEISGATNATYTTAAATSSDNGNTYYVIVKNEAGQIQSNTATLTVIPLPTITSQPQSTTVAAGGTATFNVTATGTAAANLTYRWYRNSTIVQESASNTLTITNVTTANAGNYRVDVIDSGVAITPSNTVTLTVNYPRE